LATLNRKLEGRVVGVGAHLTQADIRREVAGTPSTETHRHARVCVACAERLAEAALNAVRWERRGLLGRLVRIDVPQMVDELLAEIEAERKRSAA
jgi:hypothetical protein